jgi:hypothetical protein
VACAAPARGLASNPACHALEPGACGTHASDGDGRFDTVCELLIGNLSFQVEYASLLGSTP